MKIKVKLFDSLEQLKETFGSDIIWREDWEGEKSDTFMIRYRFSNNGVTMNSKMLGQTLVVDTDSRSCEQQLLYDHPGCLGDAYDPVHQRLWMIYDWMVDEILDEETDVLKQALKELRSEP